MTDYKKVFAMSRFLFEADETLRKLVKRAASYLQLRGLDSADVTNLRFDKADLAVGRLLNG